MKKLLESRLLLVIVTMIFSMTMSVIATTTINSNAVSYSNSKTEETTVNGALNELFSAVDINEEIAVIKNDISNLKNDSLTLDKAYPVGSVYISVSSTNPGNILGGTWVAFGTGKTLVGIDTNNTNFNTVEKAGGSSTSALSVNNLPSHTHSIPALSGTAASTGSGYSITHGTATRTTSNNGEHVHSINGGVNGQVGRLQFEPYVSGGGAGISAGYVKVNGTYDIYAVASGAHTHTVSDYYATSISGVQAHTHNVSTTASTTGANGSGAAFNVQNPYITVYMWKRTK